MGLQKLTIEYESGKNGKGEIKALFNPEKYTLTRGVQFAEVPIPGLDAPLLQYVRGQNEKISFELFFDSTENGLTGSGVKDVREESHAVYNLLKVDGETHAPPRCKLWWGTELFSFSSKVTSRCVLESVSEEFLLFSPEGIPLRVKLAVVFREYVTIDDQLKAIPRHSPDRTHIIQVDVGETLPFLAFREYGDSAAWRVIADENQLEHPRLLTPGQRLKIPRFTGTER